MEHGLDELDQEPEHEIADHERAEAVAGSREMRAPCVDDRELHQQEQDLVELRGMTRDAITEIDSPRQ